MNIQRKKPTKNLIGRKSMRLLNIRHTQDLSEFLSVPLYKLQLKSIYPQYHRFSVQKPGGNIRWVEDPSKKLKEIQRALNNHLQCVYYNLKTDAAFGFVINAWRDHAPRNIVTNAKAHMGCRSMVNMDFSDFFHQVTQDTVRSIFLAKPFKYKGDLADLITRIVTYRGRLPMGAPTSPVLSNFACIGLDHDLLALARRKNLTYTRFVDDLTFSSMKDNIPEADIHEIRQYANIYRFSFNEQKTKIYVPGETKIVTGLALEGDHVTIPDDFLISLERDIERIRHVNEAQILYQVANPDYLERYRQVVEGKIQFISYVHGKHHPLLYDMNKAYTEALQPEIPEQVIRWTDIPYGFFHQ